MKIEVKFDSGKIPSIDDVTFSSHEISALGVYVPFPRTLICLSRIK